MSLHAAIEPKPAARAIPLERQPIGAYREGAHRSADNEKCSSEQVQAKEAHKPINTSASVKPAPAAPVSASAQPKQSPAPELRKAIDYQRHAGLPGFLYIARNDEHLDYVFKLGYTTVDPQHRAERLSRQLALSGDIGEFRIVHSVGVTAAYDTEQALFDALVDRRIAKGREFFYADELALFCAMRAASRLCEGSTAELTDFLDGEPWKHSPMMHKPRVQSCPSTTDLPEARGWAIACRNPWHRPETFRIAFTTRNPQSFIHRLNSPQRVRTSQIGFFDLVICCPVRDLSAAKRVLSRSLAPFKIAGKRSFIRTPLEGLRRAFEAMTLADAAAAVEPTADRGRATDSAARSAGRRSARPEKLIIPRAIDEKQEKAWTTWTATCPHCDQLLRFTDRPGTHGDAVCPACGSLFTCFIGKEAVTIGLYC